MIALTPVQAKNLLNNLTFVGAHYGFPSVLTLLERIVGNRQAAGRLETVLLYLSSGLDETITLSSTVFPPVAGKVAQVGLEMIQHPNFNLTYYRVDRQRLLLAVAETLHIGSLAARTLLARPEKLSYADYMQSPMWAVRRAAALAEAVIKGCQKCGRSKGVLEVHHVTYLHLGHELPQDLMVVCPVCHEKLDKRAGTGKGRKAVQHG